MEIAIILSLEHPTLPEAELKAVLKAENISYVIKKKFNGFIVLKIEETSVTSGDLIKSLNRLSMAHEIFQVNINTNKEDLLDEIEQYPWKEIVNGEYAVRVKKRASADINTLELERKIGAIIKEKIDGEFKVNLEDPQIFIRTVILDDEVFMGSRLIKIPKDHFFKLKPHKRPFFYPGSMSPKLARCMVNLTGIKRGDSLLDPFCGTGGILIEAGIIGSRVIGTDIDPKMVKGTIKNLTHCGISDFEVFGEDVRNLKLPYKVDAVTTDPPYGISASTKGEESQRLCEDALLSLEKLIKDDGRICMATPHYMDIERILDGTKFKITEQYHIRMHKSLTRVISVLEKKK
ncbi:MAG: TIGR01177 family methyltransferase [Methanobacterium sp.]|nr:TIGR01177 family methyltransferase [Methanobacterium sp.]